jgi:hypothetical protein
MLQLTSLQKRRLAGLTVALLIALGFTATHARAITEEPTPFEGGSGPWRSAFEPENCENILTGTVCAEWPSADSNTVTVCCVEPGVVGTYQFVGSDCKAQLSQRALD